MDYKDIYNIIENNDHRSTLLRDGIIEFKDFKEKDYNNYIIVENNQVTDIRNDNFKIEFYEHYKYDPKGKQCFTTDEKQMGYLFEFYEDVKYYDYNIKAILLVDTNDFSIDKYIKGGNILERENSNDIYEMFYIFF